MQDIIAKVERAKLPEREVTFAPGDTVVIAMKIREGDKERVQQFQGTVIQMRGRGRGKTVTVRKASGSIYVEKIFPIHSPLISEIKVLRKGKVRRAKLYYLRERSGKATRIEEKTEQMAPAEQQA
jgi:large subunit ribosomal protein L19